MVGRLLNSTWKFKGTFLSIFESCKFVSSVCCVCKYSKQIWYKLLHLVIFVDRCISILQAFFIFSTLFVSSSLVSLALFFSSSFSLFYRGGWANFSESFFAVVVENATCSIHLSLVWMFHWQSKLSLQYHRQAYVFVSSPEMNDRIVPIDELLFASHRFLIRLSHWRNDVRKTVCSALVFSLVCWRIILIRLAPQF